MRLRGALPFWAVGCALGLAQGCGGEEFSDSSKGTGASAGSGGAAAAGGASTGGTGATAGAGGVGTGATGGVGTGATGGVGTGATGGVGTGATGGTTTGGTAGTGGVGGTSSGGTGTGGLPACGGGVCAPSVPGGWQGPLAIIDSNTGTAAACSGGYPSPQFFAHNQLSGTAPPAGCSCSCDHSGVACSNVRVDAYAAGTCSSNCCGGSTCTTVSLASGSCVVAGPALCSGVTHAAVKADVTKNCAPSVLTNLDNITWTRTIRGCQPSTNNACPTGVCVPQPGSPTTGRLCMVRDGNHACEGAYTQKISAWDTNDKRTCSNACSCLSPSCGSFQAFAAQNCTGSVMGTSPVPMACANALAQSAVLSLKYTAAASPTCTTAGTPVPGGEVQQTEISVCCLPGGG